MDKVVNSQLQSKLEYILRGEADDRVSVSYNNDVEYESNMTIKIEIEITAIPKLLFSIGLPTMC